MKKFFSLLVSILVLITAFGIGISAYADDVLLIDANNFNASFNREQGILTVNGEDAMYFCSEDSFQDIFALDGYSLNEVKKVVINEGVTVIDRYAFYNMAKLEEVTLPESLVKINGNAFKNCRKIKTVNYGGSEDEWEKVNISQLGNSFFLKAKVNCSFDTQDSEGDFYQTYTVMKHGKNVYDFNTATLTIGDKGAITDKRIDQTWFGMGDNVKYQPVCVEKLVIVDGVTRLESDVMAGCDSLEYVKIPNSVNSIEKGCFYGCDSLREIYFEGSKEQWNKIRIDEEENEDFLDAEIHYGIEEETNSWGVFIAIIALVLYSSLMAFFVTKIRAKK